MYMHPSQNTLTPWGHPRHVLQYLAYFVKQAKDCISQTNCMRANANTAKQASIFQSNLDTLNPSKHVYSQGGIAKTRKYDRYHNIKLYVKSKWKFWLIHYLSLPQCFQRGSSNKRDKGVGRIQHYPCNSNSTEVVSNWSISKNGTTIFYLFESHLCDKNQTDATMSNYKRKSFHDISRKAYLPKLWPIDPPILLIQLLVSPISLQYSIHNQLIVHKYNKKKVSN